MIDSDSDLERFAGRFRDAFGARTDEVVRRMVAEAEVGQPTVAASWRRIAKAVERAKSPR